MPRRGEKDIPIKIGGWDGHFVTEKPVLKPGYVLANKTNIPSNTTKQGSPQQQAAVASKQNLSGQHEINHKIHIEGDTSDRRDSHSSQYASVNPHSNVEQNNSNVSNMYGRSSSPTILPTKWDGTFAKASNNGPTRIKPSQHTNTNNFYGYSTEPEILPAQWDGKFAPNSGGPYRPKPNPYTNTNNFYGYSTEPEILPVQWDGKFAKGTEVRIKPETNQSDFRKLYGVTSESEILPAQWDGKFTSGNPENTYYVPDRNQSMTNDFYGYTTEPEILPVQWSGKFETDPNDVRIMQERNQSDVRDYADHRNFKISN